MSVFTLHSPLSTPEGAILSGSASIGLVLLLRESLVSHQSSLRRQFVGWSALLLPVYVVTTRYSTFDWNLIKGLFIPSSSFGISLLFLRYGANQSFSIQQMGFSALVASPSLALSVIHAGLTWK